MESIAICVCTYKRYDSLKKLLGHLLLITKPDSYQINFVVVDNDPAGSASKIQHDFGEVHYFLETRKGVSSARNRAIDESRKLNSDLVAFLDDDEIPSEDWLISLLSTMEKYNADVVAGPVITTLSPELKAFSPFMRRKRHPTGTSIKYWGAGNVLLRARVFEQVGLFSEEYSETGGEDTQFSARCNQQGLSMVWADAATVFEPTDATRANSNWLNKRAYANGRIIVRVERELGNSNTKARTVIALLRLLAGTVGWPVSLIIDQLFRSNYKIMCTMSIQKALGMIKELL